MSKLDEKALEAAARAHDAEDAAQKGEPSPWRDDIAGQDEEWKAERIASMQCAITAYLSALGDGWQPIETAPKDGTVIIGAAWRRMSDGGERIWRCWWQPEFDGWIEGCRQMTMAPGYTIDGQTQKLHSPDHAWPTHWRPLPPPPAAKDPQQ